MGLTVLVDTFAWVEYFRGTQRGKAVKELVDGPEPLLVSPINLAEMYVKEQKEMGEARAKERVKFIVERCEIVPIGDELAISAAKEKIARGFGLADAIIYATASLKEAKIMTGDKHFKGLEKTIFI